MSPTIRYSPGSWLALGGRTTWLLLERALDASVLDVLWPAVRDGASVWELAHAVLSINDQDDLPAFGLVRLEGNDVRMLLRGAVQADVDGQIFAAQLLETWLETVLTAPSSVVLKARGVSASAVTLPWGSGVTLAEALSIHLPTGDAQPDDGPRQSATEEQDRPSLSGGCEEPEDDEAASPVPTAVLGTGSAAFGAPNHPAVHRPGGPQGVDEEEVVTGVVPSPRPGAAAQPQLPGEPLQAPQLPPVEGPQARERPRGKYDHVQEDSVRADADAALVQERNAAALARSEPPEADEPPDVALSLTPAPEVQVEDAEDDADSLGTPIMIMEVPPFAASSRASPSPYGVVHEADLFPSEVPSVVQGPPGVLRLPNGDAVVIDKAVLLGRNPAAPPGREQDPPHLVKLANPERDISSTHLEVRPDGDYVLLTDLSRNGTHVVLPGRDAERLPRAEAVPVPPGTRVFLNDTVVLTLERLA